MTTAGFLSSFCLTVTTPRGSFLQLFSRGGVKAERRPSIGKFGATKMQGSGVAERLKMVCGTGCWSKVQALAQHINAQLLAEVFRPFFVLGAIWVEHSDGCRARIAEKLLDAAGFGLVKEAAFPA